MNEYRDLIPDFLDEASEHLANIEDDVLAMEACVLRQEETDSDIINRIFRAIHSIKGGSSFVGFFKIEELSHKMEDLLNFIRNGDIEPVKQTIDVLLKSIDKLNEMIENAIESNDEDISEYVKELKQITNQGLKIETLESVENVINTADIIAGTNFTVSKYVLEKKFKKGSLILIRVNTKKHIEANKKTIIDFVSELSSFGEILDTSIDLDILEDEELYICFLYFTVMEEDLVRMTFSYIPPEMITRLDESKIEKIVSTREKAASEQSKKKSSPENSIYNDAQTKSIQQQKEMDSMSNSNQTTLMNDSTQGAKAVSDESSKQVHNNYMKSNKPDLGSTLLIDSPEEDESDWEKYNEFVTFYIGGEQYAVPIFLVQEIKEMQIFSLIPNQPEYVIGMINLRGNVVPIFDMRKKLNVEEKEFDHFTVVLILKIKDQIKGCVVDAISDVVLLEPQDKQSTPMLSRNINTEYVKFIGKDPKSQSFLIVLDIDKILEED